MTYDVEFSIEAAAELLRITEVVGSAVSVLKSAEAIRRTLEDDPAGKGDSYLRACRTPVPSVLPNRITDSGKQIFH